MILWFLSPFRVVMHPQPQHRQGAPCPCQHFSRRWVYIHGVGTGMGTTKGPSPALSDCFNCLLLSCWRLGAWAGH